MRLDRLLGDVEALEVRGDPNSVEVGAVTYDARHVVAGSLHCCLRGSRVDGHDLAPAAVEAGAVALVCERFLPALAVPQVRVADARAAMAPAAAALFGHPSTALSVVGVTGTNGKTTTVHLLAAVLEAHGWATGVVGTLSGARTTPESADLQARLARFRDEGRAAVAMEVSSHALAQHRVDAVRFAVAVFTNLSQDHLDYHGTMEEYFAAKARLFETGRAEAAVVDSDDPYGRRLIERLRGRVNTYSLADAVDLQTTPDGSRFWWRGVSVQLRLAGSFNVSNALAAATAAHLLGVGPAEVAEGLGAVSAVPGRFERVDRDQALPTRFPVVVDYAHTPDALRQVLTVARSMTEGHAERSEEGHAERSEEGYAERSEEGHGGGRGRVLVVFGCGGGRDPGKRPFMGEVATRLADLAVLTSDNPRGEDPLAIIEEVRAGVGRPERLVVEPDRAAAIHLAVAEARPGDVVVIAGKGHETGQEIGGHTLPFDDRQVARQALAARVGAGR